MADQGTNKTGFARDDEFKREAHGELKASRAVRSEEAYEPQPSGEDQPAAEWLPADRDGAAPAGMTPRDVQERSELARYLERGIFPATRNTLLEALHRHQAPDTLMTRVGALPAKEKYPNVQAVARTLGYGVESRRT